ncbi:hypothetical protein [Frankia sp. QA3]|uniref:hypothetical protein n=1 Tax=Frankia sp. QA3 TaxID=710111 RepID=UPI000269C24D|nr:hypothetical protein [Frankia sp. QA3]EIV92808.1 hypothetical protein FraQA3DRAFT_2454 [Frankia sp. QA3]
MARSPALKPAGEPRHGTVAPTLAVLRRSLIAAVESALAAAAGTAVDFGLYLTLRPALATVPFTGSRFFAEDLTLIASQALGGRPGRPDRSGVVSVVGDRFPSSPGGPPRSRQ